MKSERPSTRPDRTAKLAEKRAASGVVPGGGAEGGQHVASALAATSPWAYASAPESRELALIRPRYGLFIDGEERAPSDGETVVTYNPATEEPLAEVAKGSAADADRAIAAADRSHRKIWSRLEPRERAKYLYRISRILQERSREFAVTETLDSGKPIRESRDVDVPLAAAHFWYYAGWADKLQYAVPGRRPEAHGVVGQVIPWNFPLLMLSWKLAPALACGNTVVLKPAQTTPLTALLWGAWSLPALILTMALMGLVSGPMDVAMFTVRQRRTDPAWMGRAFAISMSLNFSGYPIGSAIGAADSSSMLMASPVPGQDRDRTVAEVTPTRDATDLGTPYLVDPAVAA